VRDKIGVEQVAKVAKLSRLELSDKQAGEFAGQLAAIIEYVNKMNELDTEGVEPLAHCLPISNCLRADEVADSLGTEKTLAGAPRRDGPFFLVPRILDDGSAP
jgi:aspartyl-tRNA(Asn)/glutamyl-tRNA(Gln) amidotransferase subunit C